MMPMRDGVRLYALILFPKDKSRRNLPAVLIRNPYLVDPEMVRGFITSLFAPYVQSFLENGYAVVYQNERGRYFSEGTYTYLVRAGDDGYDSVEWLAKQPWSNGKVGTFGCSSSAEEQHKLNGTHPPGFAAAVPMGSGAGIGKVGPYNEMGNFYRGGAVQMWWFWWFHGYAYTYRPLFPATLSREIMIKLHRYWNLEPETVPSSGIDTNIWALPINTIMEKMGGTPSDMDDFVNRLPNDPRWREVDFGGEGDRASAPILLINSWYDVSIGPNVAMYEYQLKNALTEAARSNTRMIIAPTTHCEQGRVESEHTIVGERDMGDARFDYVRLTQKWFDHFLKGLDNDIASEPRVRAYMMGANQWRSYDSWPPKQAASVSYYLDSDGKANSLLGNGRLVTVKPNKMGADAFTYDPLIPVPSRGGNICCFTPVLKGGSYDQSSIEMRTDVLVYTTPPLEHPVEMAGPVKVSLYLSSDRKDTDLTLKLLDVYPNGKAYNLDESIERVRWREGWDKPVLMTPGQVYKV
jgi:putative CocE/NonD family hydrolase